MRSKGFTLIEILVVVAIIGILSAIALPSYAAMIRKSHRVDATSGLTAVQLAEEKYRGNNAAYGTLVQIGLTPSSSYYTFTIVTAADTYTLTATATGAQAQDTDCAVFTITQSASGVVYAPAACWK